MTPENSLRISIENLERTRCAQWPHAQDNCLTCAMCSGACPVAGVDDFDPRKIVRLISMGMTDAAADSRWPWICTMCGKCEQICPMGIEIPDIIRRLRAMRARDKVPGILQDGLANALRTGNNLGLPKEDFVFILEDVAAEIAEEPGFEEFTVPIDKEGAALLTTIHNKLVNTHTDDLKHWWKIFHAAGEDWTVASDNWEGTSWGYFTGDDEAMRVMAGRIVENMRRLKIKTLLWPE
ncbi:MAG: 4Fe-4S dicluster domain-containing protein [Desulfobacteraceae bacterium]|nr:4Fe-4S dicluster domain-containing protein [Desulfobacteraceae bacterium]